MQGNDSKKPIEKNDVELVIRLTLEENERVERERKEKLVVKIEVAHARMK